MIGGLCNGIRLYGVGGTLSDRSYKRRAGSVTYKRIEVAAEAIRFAMEDFRLSYSWALIFRMKRKGSTASKFACCMKARNIHFLAGVRQRPKTSAT